MERPILTISSRDFLTGIAPSAHTERGGLFFSADGVTPVYDPGGTASIENGLLQAGPTPTDFTESVVVDVPFASVTGVSGNFFYMLGASGHLYSKGLAAASVTDERSATPITSPANGLTIWAPAGGTNQLYYWQLTQIGRWDGTAYPGGFTDALYSGLTSTKLHPVHQFVGNVYYGNYSTVGALLDAGSAAITHSTNVLDVRNSEIVTALSDDGTYLVIASSSNLAGGNRFARNTIYFWDTFSSSWQREYEIRDPFIFALKKVGSVIYALGQYGVYEVSFGGVRKVLSRLIGFGTVADFLAGYGTSRATVYNQDALIFATDTTIDSFGKLSPDLPFAYYKSFKIPSGGGRPAFVDALFDVGRVLVGTSTPKLYAFDFDAATRDTGVSPQTIYFPFKEKVQVHRMDVILGEPLASGDAFDIDTKVDEDTAAVNFGASQTFANLGAVRRVSIYPDAPVEVDTQLSLIFNLTAGAVKFKKVEVYGQPMTP